jgi:hypothetical protein
MTEKELRTQVVNKSKSYIGCKESDGSHRKIIDIYNAHKPLARGYKVSYTDAWCATFVSAVGIVCKLTSIMPTECSCSRMVELYKAIGRWKEADNHVPNVGDIMMYDWNDSGKGDNVGSPDHVGIVVSVVGDTIKVIEGNISNAVGYRNLRVDGKYIRGYCLPDYASMASNEKPSAPELNLPMLSEGDKGNTVKAMQAILIGYGYSCGWYGADGDFGTSTYKALCSYQKANGLEADGICGPLTWTKLLGV